MSAQFCPYCNFPIDPSISSLCPVCGNDTGSVIACSQTMPPSSSTSLISKSVIRSVAYPKHPVEVQIAFTIDRTGSSSQFTVGIKKTCKTILDYLVTKAQLVTCWVQSHGDLDYNEKNVLHTDAGTPDQAMKAIESITFSGGGDLPETHLDGIENLLTYPLKNDPHSSRVAFVCLLNDETKPARSGITPKELGAEIKNRGILLYLPWKNW